MVELEGGFVIIAGGQQGGDGEGVFGQVLLDFMGECHSGQVVFAARAAFEQELSLFGDEDHFWRATISAGQGF